MLWSMLWYDVTCDRQTPWLLLPLVLPALDAFSDCNGCTSSNVVTVLLWDLFFAMLRLAKIFIHLCLQTGIMYVKLQMQQQSKWSLNDMGFNTHAKPVRTGSELKKKGLQYACSHEFKK